MYVEHMSLKNFLSKTQKRYVIEKNQKHIWIQHKNVSRKVEPGKGNTKRIKYIVQYYLLPMFIFISN